MTDLKYWDLVFFIAVILIGLLACIITMMPDQRSYIDPDNSFFEELLPSFDRAGRDLEKHLPDKAVGHATTR